MDESARSSDDQMIQLSPESFITDSLAQARSVYLSVHDTSAQT